MQDTVPLGKGSMIAVLGSNTADIIKLPYSIDKKDKIFEIANDNAIGQIIISGNKEEGRIFQKELKQ